MLLAPTWIITAIQLLTCCTTEVTKISFAISKKKITQKSSTTGFHVPPALVWGKEGRGILVFSVGEAPLDDWANCGSVDVFFTCGEFGFSSTGI